MTSSIIAFGVIFKNEAGNPNFLSQINDKRYLETKNCTPCFNQVDQPINRKLSMIQCLKFQSEKLEVRDCLQGLKYARHIYY